MQEADHRNPAQLLWDAPIAMAITENRCILDVNRAFCSLMGYSKEELCNQSIRLLYQSDEEYERVGRIKFAVIAEKGWADVETRWRTRDGEVKEILATSSQLATDGAASRVFVVVRDISKRKAAERELAVQSSRWFELFADSPEGIVLLAPNFTVITANSEFCRMFGYTAEQLIGVRSIDLIIPPDRQEEMQAALERLQRGETVRIEHTVRRTRDGRLLPVSIVSKPIHVDGDSIGYYGIYRDITERVTAEQEIRRSLQEKEVLLKEIHHRVKNNLNIIISLLSLQQAAHAEPALQEPLELAKARVHSMAMIHELLYRARSLAQVPFRQYIEDLVHHLGSAYGVIGRNVEVRLDVEDVSFDINTAVPAGLLVNEIIVNSIKHAFPDGRGGEIAVELHEREDGYLLQIGDNGVGPPPGFKMESARSVGMELIRGLSAQLGAQLSWDFQNGTEYRLLVPRRARTRTSEVV